MATRKLTKEDARKLARSRQAEIQAEADRKDREEREAREAARKARLEANEESMAAFYQQQSAIEVAAVNLKQVTADSEIQMGTAIADIVSREGSVGAAAKLLGITTGRAKSLTQLVAPPAADEASAEPQSNSGAPAQAPDTGAVQTGVDAVHEHSTEDTAQTAMAS
jgi:hypothetical protein